MRHLLIVILAASFPFAASANTLAKPTPEQAKLTESYIFDQGIDRLWPSVLELMLEEDYEVLDMDGHRFTTEWKSDEDGAIRHRYTVTAAAVGDSRSRVRFEREEALVSQPDDTMSERDLAMEAALIRRIDPSAFGVKPVQAETALPSLTTEVETRDAVVEEATEPVEQAAAPVSPTVISKENLRQIKKQMRNSFKKVDVVKDAATKHQFTSKQALQLVEIVPRGTAERIDTASILYGRVVDPENFHEVFAAFEPSQLAELGQRIAKP